LLGGLNSDAAPVFRVAMLGYYGGAIATEWAAELASTFVPDVNACMDAARQMVESDSMLALQDGDGRWGWVAYGQDGTPTARSPYTYDNAAACGSALRELRGLLALERA